MTAPEFLEAELEEILIYEDLFLEYFNAFLALPAFPVRLFYDRLIGNVRELDGVIQVNAPGYGANDLQRERTLYWLKQERLSLFRKSPLFLEYQLAKLLLRPLEDPQPVSRYGIRGYSRQTNSAALSTSYSSVAPHQLISHSVLAERSAGLIRRLPNRVYSTPAASGYESETYILSLLEQYRDVLMRLYQPLGPQILDGGLYTSFAYSGTRESNATAPLAMPNQLDPPVHPTDPDDARMSTQTGDVERAISDQHMEWTEMEDIYTITEEEDIFLKQHNLTPTTLQQLKEEALSTREGMVMFISFLQGTLGSHLLHFWMDCEEFKETSIDLEINHSPENARQQCVHLFRSIQNKYQSYLSPECQEQIRLCQQNWGPSYHALRRSQYDGLRRLRSYWIPRFLIHRQRHHRLRQKTEKRKLESTSLENSDVLPDVLDSATMTSMSSHQETHWSKMICSQSPLDKLIPALKNDREAGGIFMYYLKRFEPQQYTQIFLLWQELSACGEWGPEEGDSSCQQEVIGTSTDAYPLASIPLAGTSCVYPKQIDPALGGSPLSDLASAYRWTLAALCDPWIRFLNYDITMFLKFCVPVSYKKTQESETSAVSASQKRTNKDKRLRGLNYEDNKKKFRRKKDRRTMMPGLVTGYVAQSQEDLHTALEMLQQRAVYKAYRRVVQETEEPQTLKVLDIFHALQHKKENRKLLGLIQKVLEMDGIQNPQLQVLRKHLTNDLSKGKISNLSVEQATFFLSTLLAASFNKFWSEMLGRLKDYGVEQSGNEGLARLEPIIQALTTKMVLKRLHGQKSNMFHPVQMQPSAEDISAFTRALQLASQGWPTPEVLHFLRYLQAHGPQEELPLLDNNLLCCLEVQKYKNSHHSMPDRGLLKRKVNVIKERFLSPQANPVLQLSPELAEATLREAEAAAQAELPPVSIFNHLHDALSDTLLPFWAGFQKTWLMRSPASAQRAPLLRAQQMLRKRLALFQLDEKPLRTFHLPPIQQPPEKEPPSTVTFSFSISHGITLKENSVQGGDAETPIRPDSRTRSQAEALPPITTSSPEGIQLR
ncbi:uncharacterized protein LOC134910619 isoform X2 [Pseudophryne corroboree]|uniref:uncharacterized protein LOC134910619 isoform X2 n=1 Tax=Pseudophryne corroboree TaxID=495146 RepID=UPI003081E3D3